MRCWYEQLTLMIKKLKKTSNYVQVHGHGIFKATPIDHDFIDWLKREIIKYLRWKESSLPLNGGCPCAKGNTPPIVPNILLAGNHHSHHVCRLELNLFCIVE